MNPALLRIASCMAPDAGDTCRAITRYLQRKLGIATAWRLVRHTTFSYPRQLSEFFSEDCALAVQWHPVGA